MDACRYTVIVAMPRYRADEPVLVSLQQRPASHAGAQVLVAEGRHPARQRNAALALARGEIIVFLDNDCSLDSGYWKELDSVFARAEVAIVGGPALLRPRATFWEEVFHALLTHSLIVGTVSARYAPRGEFRRATQTELILCNLALRRSVFDQIGPLSTDLFPNEENEWLDRARAADVSAWYDPNLQVFRPQRSSPGAMAQALFRYGMGRTRQFRVSGWHFTFHQMLPLLVIGTAAAVLRFHLGIAFAVLWLTASVLIAGTCGAAMGWTRRLVAGLFAPLVPLTYSLGQLAGWFALLSPETKEVPEITVTGEKGERLPSSRT
jgi:GT2 family glycosyltransferase